MAGGVRGTLISTSFAADVLPTLPGAAAEAPPLVQRALDEWAQRCDDTLGPASSVRAISEVAALPLIRTLGFAARGRIDRDDACALQADGGRASLTVLVSGWGVSLSRLWRPAVIDALSADARWCLCCNGVSLRLVDARRTWSRDYLELDIAWLGRDPAVQGLLWSLLRSDALAEERPLLERAIELSSRQGAEVCRALGAGVLEALQLLVNAVRPTKSGEPHTLFEQALTVLYRVLFLLFAEARGLLPLWHPVYRDRYSLEAIVGRLVTGRPYKGLGEALRAISRLVHSGCTAGELKVTAFNGRLFSPAHVGVFDAAPPSDAVLERAVVAVTTRPARAGDRRTRIAYADLDVEQLGAVYEHVLDYEPTARSPVLARTGDIRKATGTFYTPRTVTAFMTQKTLAPLVRGRSSSEILKLKVVDPAMGSGAFLVAACRFLAQAVEDALVAEGTWHPHDVTAADRAALRREIASRCLYGVDLNPMAVQLARLSLWLATLAGDRPLSFLDHHLVVGDSLVGATPSDVARGSRAGRRPRTSPRTLPLFDAGALAATFQHAARIRLELAAQPDVSALVVREKERTFSRLRHPDSPLGRWMRVMDLWCAAWFTGKRVASEPGTFAELTAHILTGRSGLPAHVADPLVGQSDRLSSERRFLHWPFAFPEVFVDESGEPLPAAGFDAVIGNPPWDMVRGDSGTGDTRDHRRLSAGYLTAFVRDSGVYRVGLRAHVNRYQLFTQRALQVVRPGGRIGFVLPSGIASDAGAAPLRRYLFDAADLDELTGIDNRAGIFPIHRGVRFVLLTATAGRPTTSIQCRFGITDAEDLERPSAAAPVVLTRRLLARLSGEGDLGVPELSCERDLRIVERISWTIPRLSDERGWGARFGRELNASDDRAAFEPVTADSSARPVVEGKLIGPFRVDVASCRLQLKPHASQHTRVPRRNRLAYRDVASATNRLTLIAAIVPAQAVTTHTLFCLKIPLPVATQHVLCALLNSFVANYLIRFRVNIHVTASLVARLPVPLVSPPDQAFDRLLLLARALTRGAGPVEAMPEYAGLQALAAHLYGLDDTSFEHVLTTFPLMPRETRRAALAAFHALH